MKEQIETIPVNDAFDAGDECPFCYLERMAEQRTIRYVAGPGASYMEPDVRGSTDKYGFCIPHSKKLFDYGNALGAALMLQTHFAGILEEFHAEAEAYAGQDPTPHGLFRKKPEHTVEEDYSRQVLERVDRCFICDRIAYHMDRYYATFFALLKEPEFRAKVENSKGFCLKHFGKLLKLSVEKVPKDQRKWFHDNVFRIEEENLLRVKEDLDWFIAKYDYRNAKADWKNSRDALSRTMQKLEGFYPADPPYKKE